MKTVNLIQVIKSQKHIIGTLQFLKLGGGGEADGMAKKYAIQ